MIANHVQKSTATIVLLVWTLIAFNASGYGFTNNYTTSDRPCQFDRSKPWPSLKLLDLHDGIPFVNEGGVLKKTTRILKEIPRYTLELAETGTLHDLYDLKLEKEYLSLLDNGNIVFTSESTKGTTPKKHGDQEYLTSIFTLNCAGDLSIALPDHPFANLTINSRTSSVHITSPSLASLSAFQRRSSTTPSSSNSNQRLHRFLKRTIAASSLAEAPPGGATKPSAARPPIAFLAPPSNGRPLISDHWQTGWAPRCTKKVPLGLVPFVKLGARGAYYNGCGAENGMKVPDLRFEECCNQHDLCYDNCGMTWEDCNDNFRECNHVACDVSYPLSLTSAYPNPPPGVPPPGVASPPIPSPAPVPRPAAVANNDFNFDAGRNTSTSTSASISISSSSSSSTTSNSNSTTLTAATATPSSAPWISNATLTSWLNWGCHTLADTYADAVNTRFGAWAFQASNDDRCECRCPVGAFDCGDNCMLECEAINEAGAVEVRKGAPGYYYS